MTTSSHPVAQGQPAPFWTGPRIWAAAAVAGLVAALVFPLPFGAHLSDTAVSLGLAIAFVSAAYAGGYRPRNRRR